MTDSSSLRGKTLSHYRIIIKLDGGVMGATYKAEDLTLSRFEALKILPSRPPSGHRQGYSVGGADAVI
jgi:hypothetical protein